MKTVHALVAVVVLLVVNSSAEAQTLHRVAAGVHVVVVSGLEEATARNLGVVEFEEFLLVVDACEASEWEAISEALSSVTSKPVQYLVRTHGAAADECLVGQSGVTHLAPSETGLTEFRGESPAIATDVVLEDASRRAVLRRVRVYGGEDVWTVLAGDSEVLFAGNLVGQSGGTELLPINDWMTELRRLVRLSPDFVVPGHGPIGDPELLRDTRGALARAKNTIADMVDNASVREDVLESVRAIGRGVLSEETVEHLYDEHIGSVPATAFIERTGLREGPSPTAGSSGWNAPKTVVVADLWPGRTEQMGLVAPGIEVLVAKDREHAADLVYEENADAILGWLTPEILENGEHLRWVSLFSAGIESYLEIPGFRDNDIVLTNGQRLYANGGAEHVLGMVLALSRRLNTAVQLQGERRWDNAPLTGPTPITGDGSELGELRGKTILVAGLGGIGTEVARLADGIGMHVIATRASRREGPPFVEYVGLAHELPYLARESDVIVNCLPLTAETEGVFDDEFFRQAKSTAYLINIGRGKTVDTDALVGALRDGNIAGAALDVTEPEPLPSDHVLWGMPNVIITPHVGGDSERHMERIWLLFRENLRRFAVGEPLLSVVDKRRGY